MGPGFFFTPWSSDPNIAVNSVGKMPPTSGNVHQVRNVETGEICKVKVVKFCSSYDSQIPFFYLLEVLATPFEANEEGEVEVLTKCRMFNYYHKQDEGPIEWVRIPSFMLFQSLLVQNR